LPTSTVNIMQDPLNGKFIAWVGKPEASGAAIGSIVETILRQKLSEDPPKDHGPKRATLTRVLSAPKHKGKRVSDFYEPAD
jgi:hypothetical protein